MRKLFQWAASSMIGCVAAGEACISFPLWFVFAAQSNANEQLVLERVACIVFVAALAGLIFGILLWSTFVKPLRQRLKSKGMLKEPRDK